MNVRVRVIRYAKAAAPWVLGLGILVCWALLMFAPTFPKSTAGWAALVFVGIPLLFAGEFLGNLVFGSTYAKNWPKWVRIPYGVVAALVLLGRKRPRTPVLKGLA